MTRGKSKSSDILLGLHALHAREALLAAQGPRVCVVTGTDLNGPDYEMALDTLGRVDRIVVRQSADLDRLPLHLRARTRVILPSVQLPGRALWRPESKLAVSLGHLRAVKDPLLLPQALEQLPDWRGIQAGQEIEEGWGERLRGWPRFEWVGSLDRKASFQLLGRAACFVLSSHSEGCSNALCEAVALGLPVLASDIPGNVGLLGADYEGLFPVGSENALAHLLRRLPEIQPRLLSHLLTVRQKLAPEREAKDLMDLLAELS